MRTPAIKLIPLDQLSASLGVHQGRLTSLHAAGRLPHVRAGNVAMADVKQVRAALEAHEHQEGKGK